MQHIKNVLKKRVAQSGLEQNIKNSLAIEEFSNVIREEMGKQVLNKIKPLYLKNKVLTVACLVSVVMQEINLRKERIMYNVNKKLGYKAMLDIKFIV
ncbi:MAG: DciA family protein [Patescibacteria group bacterium]|nr:DciA family protein [Patescibacteria group bacterium]